MLITEGLTWEVMRAVAVRGGTAVAHVTIVGGVDSDLPKSNSLASRSGWTPKPLDSIGNALVIGVDVIGAVFFEGANFRKESANLGPSCDKF